MLIEPEVSTTSRFFPPDPESAKYHLTYINEIVDMVSNWNPVEKLGPPAGYTYWGQFLAHEVAPRKGESPVRTNALDLDSVYGKGWHDVKLPVCKQTGKIRLALTVSAASETPLYRDFIRNGKKIIAPEPRNDENLILAQFHILLIRFHNALVDYLTVEHRQILDPYQLFELARTVGVKIFHNITIYDYLQTVCDKSTFNWIFIAKNTLLHFDKKCPVPLEAISAIMRFGHSQIRDNYAINDDNRNKPLSFIFENTGSDELNGTSLPTSNIVDWTRFFRMGRGFQVARSIQPSVAEILNDKFSIIKRNIQSGIESLLPSGQKFVENIFSILSYREREELINLGIQKDLYLSSDQKLQLCRANIKDSTPLWIYILLEAVAGDRSGSCLGPLGSIIVGEILRTCMRNYTPPCSDIYFDEEVIFLLDIRTMSDLINFVETIEKRDKK